MKPLILKGHTRPLTCVKYNEEGDLLFTTAKDNNPCVWFTHNGERLGTLTVNGHSGTVWSIDIDRDTEFCVTGGGDQLVKVWHIETGTCLLTYDLSGPNRVVAFNEGGTSIMTVSDPFNKKPGVVRIFDLPDKKTLLDLVPKLSGKTDDNGLSVVSSGPKHEWIVTDIREGYKLNVASWLAVNAGIITGDTTGILRIHVTASGKVSRTIEAHEGKINSLTWNKPKTMFITGGADMVAKLWDGKSFTALKKYSSNTPVNAAVISPIREHALVAGGQEAMNVTTTSSRVGNFETKFFHLVFQEEWGSVKGHFGPVNTLAIHPQGTGFVSGSEDGYVRLHTFDKDYYEMHAEFDDLTALEELARDK